MKKRITAKQLMKEAEKIACFRAMHIAVTNKTADKVYIKTFYDAYKDFLQAHDLGDTPLSVDGFGKMLHLNVERKVMKIGNAPLGRGFVGAKLVYGRLKQ